MPDERRDTELILPPGVFAFVLDETKGHINTLCGPIKQSLSNTDRLVTYDAKQKRFVPAPNQQAAIQTNIIVPKGSYVVLENPASNNKQPEPGKAEVMPIGTLRMGQIENISGPQSFPLWPGQVATVVKGHHLRTNQYLMGRVYDDEAAKTNWDKSVVKPSTPEEHEGGDRNRPAKNALGLNKDSLVTGQLIVIRGTSVAFYIPPTGVEILVDEGNNYVRDAVTLERLEFSILLDEDGNKEYKIGPAVVFPTPTQQFFTKEGNRKFRAFELQPTTGLHIKVIADYEEDGVKHEAGEEMFITGVDTPIYYPREEHSLITYGGQEKSFAVAIPGGEGRYVLDRLNGNVDLVEGPAMFLPNPIKQVIVLRNLSDSECDLYYPGNEEVKRINRQRRGVVADPGASGYSNTPIMSFLAASVSTPTRELAGKASFADAITRGTSYTPPRTITIDSKYDGAVRVEVWSGFAVQVVNSQGNRRTVVGPQTILLQYDEHLERLSLSKGKPKNSDSRLNTVYLRHISNPVSDIISLKTKDLVNVDIQVKYLVRFEEDESDNWFNIDNYVQYMVDHLRSLIGNAVRNIGVQEFYSNATNILRDTVLGLKSNGESRSLKHFAENGMTVYELELISILVKDESISNLLAKAKQDTLNDSIILERAKEKLVLTRGTEDANRQMKQEVAKTKELEDRLAAESSARESASSLAAVEAEAEEEMARVTAEKSRQELIAATQAIILATQIAQDEHQQELSEANLDRQVKLLVEEAKAGETRMKAVQPALIEALVAMAQAGSFQKMAEHLAPLSIVRGESLSGTLHQLFSGTPLEGMVNNLANLSKVKTLGN